MNFGGAARTNRGAPRNFFQNCCLIILQAPNTYLMRFKEKSFQQEAKTHLKYFNKLERMINVN
jgi:hypothetical protein